MAHLAAVCRMDERRCRGMTGRFLQVIQQELGLIGLGLIGLGLIGLGLIWTGAMERDEAIPAVFWSRGDKAC